MVAAKSPKLKLTMGLHKSPPSSTPTPTPPNSTTKSSSFPRSFGAYFPRSSAQVQPHPPDVAQLLRLVEDLRNRESRLKTELLELKLLKETASIVPLLENDIAARDTEIQSNNVIIREMEAENESLRKELHEMRVRFEEEKREGERKMKALEDEIAELKKTASDNAAKALENDEISSSLRFQGLVEVSGRSNLIKSLKKTTSDNGNAKQKQGEGEASVSVVEFKREVPENEKRCDSDFRGSC